MFKLEETILGNLDLSDCELGSSQYDMVIDAIRSAMRKTV